MDFSPVQLLIVLAIILLVFGAKKLPEAARGLGRSARILQAELRAGTTPATDPEPGRPAAGEEKE